MIPDDPTVYVVLLPLITVVWFVLWLIEQTNKL